MQERLSISNLQRSFIFLIVFVVPFIGAFQVQSTKSLNDLVIVQGYQTKKQDIDTYRPKVTF